MIVIRRGGGMVYALVSKTNECNAHAGPTPARATYETEETLESLRGLAGPGEPFNTNPLAQILLARLNRAELKKRLHKKT